jgi:hypothetical protein
MGVYAIMFFVVLGVAALWVKGIHSMHENHPDYKGEDFFNEEEKEKEKK